MKLTFFLRVAGKAAEDLSPLKGANQMIFFFQFLPLLLPINQTFLCHNASVPVIINE
jgi:hypothetical protein